MHTRQATTLIGLAAVVVSAGVAVAAADDERPGGSSVLEVRDAAVSAAPRSTAPAGRHCRRGQASEATSIELAITAVDRRSTPSTAEAAIALARPHTNGLRSLRDVTFEADGPPTTTGWGGRQQVSYVGRDPDGHYRAVFDLIRGNKGGWAIRFTQVCEGSARR